MLKIYLPTDHEQERRYAIGILFQELLGLPYEVKVKADPHTIILLENSHQLIIEDHFFIRYPEGNTYLSPSNIPSRVDFVDKKSNPYLSEKDLPILFGSKRLDVSDTSIRCGVDVPASVFFMLSRWEELVCPERDLHHRFPLNASLAFKSGFYKRPVVNEMAEMIWNMLNHLGYSHKRKETDYEAIITHDVDIPRLWRGFPAFIKKLGGALLVRKDFREFLFSITSYSKTVSGFQPDPFDTFDQLMNISESSGLTSHFFFMSGGETKFDNFFNIHTPHIQRLIQNIHERGHIIGFHPSYNAYTDSKLFSRELETLHHVSPQPITCGRQHFLRFEVPQTWQLWEDHGLEWESSLGYADQNGFRCGICSPFPVFHCISRRKLKLKEIPLLAMDTTFAIYQNASPEALWMDICDLYEKTKKYGGSFVLLWHNSSFNAHVYQKYQNQYETIIAKLAA